MIKINVKVQEYDAEKDDVVEREVTLRFNYTLQTVKFYEQRTGHNFYTDFKKATETLTNFIGEANVDQLKDIDNLPDSEKMKFMPLLTNPEINQFMMELVPVMYAKPENGALVQGDETIEEAENAPWLVDLVNLESFMQMFTELTRFGDTGKTKKSAASKKKSTKK